MEPARALFGLSPQIFFLKISLHVFLKTSSEKISYIFSKKAFLYLRKQKPKKAFYILGNADFRARKYKKNPPPKIFIIFQEIGNKTFL